MLVLSRKRNESLTIGDDITIRVCDIVGDRVKIGIDAPTSMKILRSELSKDAPEGEKEQG